MMGRMKPTAGFVVEPTSVIASLMLGMTILSRKQTTIRHSVVIRFSFFVKRRFGFPFATISSTVSFAGRTTSGAALAIAKKRAKLPTRIGMTEVGYGACKMLPSSSA